MSLVRKEVTLPSCIVANGQSKCFKHLEHVACNIDNTHFSDAVLYLTVNHTYVMQGLIGFIASPGTRDKAGGRTRMAMFRDHSITHVKHLSKKVKSDHRVQPKTEKRRVVPLAEVVNFSKKTTVVCWDDHSKTQVSCAEGDELNPRVAFLYAFFEKATGKTKRSVSKYLDAVADRHSKSLKVDARKAAKETVLQEKRDAQKAEALVALESMVIEFRVAKEVKFASRIKEVLESFGMSLPDTVETATETADEPTSETEPTS